MNEVFLMGRLGKDPDFRMTNTGREVCNFTVATEEKVKKDDGSYESRTEWHNVSTWNNINFLKEHLKKGTEVIVKGKIAYRDVEDPQTGKVQRYTSVQTKFVHIGRQPNPNKQTNERNLINEAIDQLSKDVPW